VVHILDDPDDQQSEVARLILSFVICAERPLLWKEIQSRFCINIQHETADPDFRLLEPCKTYCGSLVEVGRDAPDSEATFASDELRGLIASGSFDKASSVTVPSCPHLERQL
jgi:hypothetical protein